jgi:hypothetical protein
VVVTAARGDEVPILASLGPFHAPAGKDGALPQATVTLRGNGMPSQQLFLVVLGGRAAGAHIELHDVRFVAGASIEDTVPELRRQWFGARKGLHLDSWMAVRFVAGYRVELRREPFDGPERLWFVNLGGYDPAQLAEQHAFGLFVATSPAGAKAAARRSLLPQAQQRHKDDLHGVEEALATAAGERWWVHLIADGRSQNPVPDWLGYRPI